MELDSKYHVGDKVLIGDVHKCAFGWNEDMEGYSGEICTIERVTWSRDHNVYRYEIDLDDRNWMWDDSCFESEMPDLPEFTANTSGLTGLFS